MMELNWVTVVFAMPIIIVFLIGVGNFMGPLVLVEFRFQLYC